MVSRVQWRSPPETENTVCALSGCPAAWHSIYSWSWLLVPRPHTRKVSYTCVTSVYYTSLVSVIILRKG